MATTTSLPKTDRWRWARQLTVVVGLVLGLQAGSFLLPAPAMGHALLLDADPAPNSVVPASPARLALFFSEAVDPGTVGLRILDSEGRPVIGVGAPRLDASGLVLSAALPTLDPDTYTVEYAVVSAVDGHPTVQVFAFVVDPTGTEPPPSLPLPTEPTVPPDPASIAARWLTTISALLLAGSAGVWLFHRRWIGAEERVPVPRLLLAGMALTALLALLAYVARSATVAFAGGHLGHTEGLPLDPVAPFGWTPFAIAMRIALAGAVVAVVLTLSAGAAAGRRRLAAIGAAAVTVLFGLSLTGHAAALGGPVWALVDAAHLLGVAAWLGALPALVLLASRSDDRRSAFVVHARVALVAAPLVVVTGLANSPLVVDEPRELAASGYGNLLLTKAILVSLALGLGAASYLLARGGSPRRLAVLAGGEMGLAVVAILVGATMVSIQPAADRPPATVDPRLGVAHVYAEGGESTVHGIVDLPEPGVQSYSFAVADPETGAGREDVAQVIVTFVPPPGAALPSNTELATPTRQPFIWTLRGAYTPVVGNWELEIVVRRGRLEEDRMAAPLAVREVLRSPRPLPPPTTGGQVLGALAAPSAWLPPGAAGWAVPVVLLTIGAGLLAIERRRARAAVDPPRALQVVRLASIGAAVVLGVSLAARDVVTAANRPPEEWINAVNLLGDDPAAVPAGEELYLANCASCHGATGAGVGPAVGDLARAPADLAAIVPHRLDGELAWTIGAGLAGTQMPAFGTTLLESERWELVSFLRSRWPLADEQASP